MSKFLKKAFLIALVSLTALSTGLSSHAADTADQLLKQQQELTAKINRSRSNISELQKSIDRLDKQIPKAQKDLAKTARMVQTSNITVNIVSALFSSTSLTVLVQRVVTANMVITAANRAAVKLEQDKKDKTTALSSLTNTQKTLDADIAANKASLDAYYAEVAKEEQAAADEKAKQEAASRAVPSFTPATEKTASSESASSSSASSESQSSSSQAASSSQQLASSSTQPSSQAPAPAPVVTVDDATARANIVARESSGNYSARNGRYYGAYQLDIDYLHGDLSPANQDAVANAYVIGRYGSWSNAWTFWQQHSWY